MEQEFEAIENAKNKHALKIQKLWRAYTNKKIYKYYRDIIYFKCKGNPARLLKAINPNEAQLLDGAANVHLRFRLGGETFPPNIYYKVFLHGAYCDVNSYAPRDYSTLKKPQNIHSHPEKKILFEEYKKNKEDYQNEGWYLRIDNNGWRPISHKLLNKTDYIELFSANKIRYHHFKKDKRVEKTTKKTRLNKLRWLQSMYKNARLEEESQNQEKQVKAPEQDKIADQQKEQNMNQIQEAEQNEEYDDLPPNYNPFQDQKFIEMNEDEFDNEVKDLIEWSNNLDFDSYIKDWFHLSTSNASEKFVFQPVSVSQLSTINTSTQPNNSVKNVPINSLPQTKK